MNPQKYLELTPEDAEKVRVSRERSEGVKIDEEQLFIAEFGKHYGWEGVMAILNNKIDSETATWLLIGARKVDSKRTYDQAQAVLIGTASANAKKPTITFRKSTSDLVKNARADA